MWRRINPFRCNRWTSLSSVGGWGVILLLFSIVISDQLRLAAILGGLPFWIFFFCSLVICMAMSILTICAVSFSISRSHILSIIASCASLLFICICISQLLVYFAVVFLVHIELQFKFLSVIQALGLFSPFDDTIAIGTCTIFGILLPVRWAASRNRRNQLNTPIT